MRLFLADPPEFIAAVIFSLVGLMILYGVVRVTYLIWSPNTSRRLVSFDLLPFTLSLEFIVIGLSILFTDTIIGVLLFFAAIPVAIVLMLFHGYLISMTERAEH